MYNTAGLIVQPAGVRKDNEGHGMAERNNTSVLWNIGGCLFAICGLTWTIIGNIPIGMMNVAVAMAIIAVGASNARKAKQQNDVSKDEARQSP